MIKGIIGNVRDVIFPVLCAACRYHEPYLDDPLCNVCINTLSWIDNSKDAKAALVGKEYYPKDINYFNSLLYYTKSSRTQQILKAIKYNGDHELAIHLGSRLGREMITTSVTSTDFMLVPVPLHTKRRKERGYNQAEELAKGIIKEIPNWVINNDLLIRTVYEASQTKKGAKERSVILEKSFGIGNTSTPADQPIILVDDVITTGSTVGACIAILREAGYNNLSIVSLAVSI